MNSILYIFKRSFFNNSFKNEESILYFIKNNIIYCFLLKNNNKIDEIFVYLF